GLLRSVANPAAGASTGFVPSGSPNTNARVSADFGSNASNAFAIYTGYAAFTSLWTPPAPPLPPVGPQPPVKIFVRTLSNATLIGGAGAYGPPLSIGPTAPPP